MDHSQFIFTLFCIVFFCLGWRTITSEGQLLYFLRKPFENLQGQIENAESLSKCFRNKGIRKQILLMKLKFYMAKPVVLCITCMASVWGVVIFITLNACTVTTAPYLIIACVAASFIQTFIWNIYEKYL